MLYRVFAAAFAAFAFLSLPAAADQGWDGVLKKARGQDVFWNAWGGSEQYNAYIAWVGERVRSEYDITLRHVKLSDTADAVQTVLAEKAAGRSDDGTVDLIWINGENFKAMKDNGLLYGPFVDRLPHFALVDTAEKPTTVLDFTEPTGGLEAPWGMAKLVFIYDMARLEETPRSIPDFLDLARNRPGRFTYPAPPDFIGTTFLKQALYELVEDRAVLLQAPGENFDAVTAPLWTYLDALEPHLWRDGRDYPKTGTAQIQLLDDGEIDVALSFNPAEASSAIADGRLPETARTFVLEGGTIANTHFVAIPFNARAKEGAMVVANFLLSPEAQARKQNPDVWGEPTVLSMSRLDAEDRKRFDMLPRGVATLAADELGPALPEPHPAWMTRIEEAWLRRYGS